MIRVQPVRPFDALDTAERERVLDALFAVRMRGQSAFARRDDRVSQQCLRHQVAIRAYITGQAMFARRARPEPAAAAV